MRALTTEDRRSVWRVCFTWSLSFTTSSSWTEMVLMRLRYISQSFWSVELFSSSSSFSSRYCTHTFITKTAFEWAADNKRGQSRGFLHWVCFTDGLMGITLIKRSFCLNLRAFPSALGFQCMSPYLAALPPVSVLRGGYRGGWPDPVGPLRLPVCRVPECRRWSCLRPVESPAEW